MTVNDREAADEGRNEVGPDEAGIGDAGQGAPDASGGVPRDEDTPPWWVEREPTEPGIGAVGWVRDATREHQRIESDAGESAAGGAAEPGEADSGGADDRAADDTTADTVAVEPLDPDWAPSSTAGSPAPTAGSPAPETVAAGGAAAEDFAHADDDASLDARIAAAATGLPFEVRSLTAEIDRGRSWDEIAPDLVMPGASLSEGATNVVDGDWRGLDAAAMAGADPLPPSEPLGAPIAEVAPSFDALVSGPDPLPAPPEPVLDVAVDGEDAPATAGASPRRRREPAPPVDNPVAVLAQQEREAILHPSAPDTDDPVAQAAITRVRQWLAQDDGPRDANAERLAGLLRDPKGLDFAIAFVDRVVRPDDAAVSARNLEALSRNLPGFLDWYLKLGVTLGGGFGVVAPKAVIPLAKRAMRSMVSHLVIDATPAKLGPHLARLTSDHVRCNVNLLGEAVLGQREADRRLQGTLELLQRDDVDYVSIKVSSVVAQVNLWGFDQAVEHIVERLTPLYLYAAESSANGIPKFINLDMEEYRDLDLTIAVFTRLLDTPRLDRLHAGIVLQAYLPDALGAYERLAAWTDARIERGGVGIKIRVVKGANLQMERVDAAVHGWPLAVVGSKAEADANYTRVLRAALTPERASSVRIGVAGHNLFDLAWAIETATRNGVLDHIDIEMLLGMSAGHVEAIAREVPRVILYTPVVPPAEFSAAVAYLVRRLEENGSGENFMSGMFEIGKDHSVFERERDRFLRSLDLLARADDERAVLGPNRRQDRSGDFKVSVEDPHAHDGFFNEPDTDPALAANRAWAAELGVRAWDSTLGTALLERNLIADLDTLERRIRVASDASVAWAARGFAARARTLDDAAATLGVVRGRLIEVMMSETGKTVAEADTEVSEAIDFARYYAERARELAEVTHAEFVPVRLTVVVPPWNFPVAIPAGGILSALATGSSVIVKPAPEARRSAAVLVEALWESGVPRDVLMLCDIPEGEVSKALIVSPAVGRVILTGSTDTASLFLSWRPDLPLLAETSGKNAIVVTQSADVDLAVKDVVKSAFGHAGQKCSAASILILVGSAGTSARLRAQLVDAVETLKVAWPTDLSADVGPLIAPPGPALHSALTQLAEGESWLVEPRQLDETGRLWSPGVRAGVQPGSPAHLTEFFGPHLAVLHAPDLDTAIEWQNQVPFGLTAGIHSLDVDEVERWIDRVQAGNLYVNRGITGAIVRRQPFGGWKDSQVGPGAKAGGPNYLATLGDWLPLFLRPKENVLLRGLDPKVTTLIESATSELDFLEFDRVRHGAHSDETAWQQHFAAPTDVSGLGVERNILRYRPADVLVRLPERGTLAQLVRVLATATRAGSTVRVSSARALPAGLQSVLHPSSQILKCIDVIVESDLAFHERVRTGAAVAAIAYEDGFGLVHESRPIRRVRLAGTDDGLATALGGTPRIARWDGPVTTEGRIELLPFLLEQAISITAHRYGTPDRRFAALDVD